MAIDTLYFNALCTAIRIIKESHSSLDVLRVGCLSYPDLLITRAQMKIYHN